mgnify:CR=1 FL=1
MQSLWENKPLLYCLSLVGGITVLAASQLSPEFTEMLELVPFNNEVSKLPTPKGTQSNTTNTVPKYFATSNGG